MGPGMEVTLLTPMHHNTKQPQTVSMVDCIIYAIANVERDQTCGTDLLHVI
jgi:hypothetical protein